MWQQTLAKPARFPASTRLIKASVALWLIFAIAIWGPAQGRAAGTDPRIKAAIILNIVRFVDFGDKEAGALVLCAYRDAPNAAHLAALSGERVGQRQIAYRAYHIDNAAPCDVVYLGPAGAGAIADARKPGVLLIGDGSGFVAAGGMIGLVNAGSQLRFEANNQAARAAGIKFSSKLLRLATRVR